MNNETHRAVRGVWQVDGATTFDSLHDVEAAYERGDIDQTLRQQATAIVKSSGEPVTCVPRPVTPRPEKQGKN